MLAQYRGITVSLLFLLTPVTTASAITVDVAKKCDALLAKQFPPRVVGNPAAGAQGTAKERHDYFQKCVDNDGKMDGGGQTQSK
jgi:hypothetical protein